MKYTLRVEILTLRFGKTLQRQIMRMILMDQFRIEGTKFVFYDLTPLEANELMKALRLKPTEAILEGEVTNYATEDMDKADIMGE